MPGASGVVVVNWPELLVTLDADTAPLALTTLTVTDWMGAPPTSLVTVPLMLPPSVSWKFATAADPPDTTMGVPCAAACFAWQIRPQGMLS